MVTQPGASQLLQDDTRLGEYLIATRINILMSPIAQWYAGAPLKQSVGDALNAQGVPLYQLYGR